MFYWWFLFVSDLDISYTFLLCEKSLYLHLPSWIDTLRNIHKMSPTQHSTIYTSHSLKYTEIEFTDTKLYGTWNYNYWTIPHATEQYLTVTIRQSTISNIYWTEQNNTSHSQQCTLQTRHRTIHNLTFTIRDWRNITLTILDTNQLNCHSNVTRCNTT